MSDATNVLKVLLEELNTVLGAMTGAAISSMPSMLSGRAWSVNVTIGGTPLAKLAFDEAGASALTTAVVGDDAPADDLIADTLREVCAQAAGAAAMRLPGRSGHVDVTPPRVVDWFPAGDFNVTTLSADAFKAPMIVALEAEVAKAASIDVRPTSAKAAAPAEPSPEERLAVILDIDLPLVVRFGCTDMALKQLTRLGPGSLIDLGRSPDDPVEVLVSNRVVARGEVVVVSGSYGIRILDVVSARDRMESLGA
jgi:flagellar motor switch protein FliN